MLAKIRSPTAFRTMLNIDNKQDRPNGQRPED